MHSKYPDLKDDYIVIVIVIYGIHCEGILKLSDPINPALSVSRCKSDGNRHVPPDRRG